MTEENEGQKEPEQSPKVARVKGRVERFVMWLVCNIAMWIPAYYWLACGNTYAENYSVFMVWIHFAASLFVFSAETRRRLQERGPSVNTTFNLVLDCVYGLILATFGHYVLAAAYILGSKFMSEAYTWDT